MPLWKDVESNPGYQALSPQEQATVKGRYWQNIVLKQPDYYGLSSDQQDVAHEKFFGSPRSLIDKARDLGHVLDEVIGQFPAGAEDVATLGGLKAMESGILGNEPRRPSDITYEPQTTAGKIAKGAGHGAGFLMGLPAGIVNAAKGTFLSGVRSIFPKIAENAPFLTRTAATAVGLGTAGVASDLPESVSKPETIGPKFLSNAVTGAMLPFVEGLPIGKLGRGVLGAAIFGRAWQPGGRSTPEIVADSLIGGLMTVGYRSFDLQGEPFAKFDKMSQKDYEEFRDATRKQDNVRLTELANKLIEDGNMKVVFGKQAVKNVLGTDLEPGKDFIIREGEGVILKKSYIKGMMDSIANSKDINDLGRQQQAINSMFNSKMLTEEQGTKLADAVDARLKEIQKTSYITRQEVPLEEPGMKTTTTQPEKKGPDPFAFLGNSELSKLAQDKGWEPIALRQTLRNMGLRRGEYDKVKNIIVSVDIGEGMSQKGELDESWVKSIEDRAMKGFNNADEANRMIDDINDNLSMAKDKALKSRLEGLKNSVIEVRDGLNEVQAKKEMGAASGMSEEEKDPIKWLRKQGGVDIDKAGDMKGEWEALSKKEGGMRGIAMRGRGQSPDILAQNAEEAFPHLFPNGASTADFHAWISEAVGKHGMEGTQTRKAERQAKRSAEAGIKKGVSLDSLIEGAEGDQFKLLQLQEEVVNRDLPEAEENKYIDKINAALERVGGSFTEPIKGALKIGDIQKGDTIETKGSNGPVKVVGVNKALGEVRYRQDGILKRAPLSKITKHAPTMGGAAHVGELSNGEEVQSIKEWFADKLNKLNIMINPVEGMGERLKDTWDDMKGRNAVGAAMGIGFRTKMQDFIIKNIIPEGSKGFLKTKRALNDAEIKLGIARILATEGRSVDLGKGAGPQNLDFAENIRRYRIDFSRKIAQDRAEFESLRPTTKADRMYVARLKEMIAFEEKVRGFMDEIENLSPAEKEVLKASADVLDTTAEAMKQTGIPIFERKHYFTGRYAKDKSGNPIKVKAYQGLSNTELMADSGQLGEVGKSLIQRKVFANPLEGILHGYMPDLRLVEMTSDYIRKSSALMSGRQFIESMKNLNDEHGNPILTTNLYHNGKYEIVHMLGSDYSVLKEAEGTKVAAFMRNEFTASPELTQPLLRLGAKINMEIKNIKTVGSGFHWITEAMRALTSNVNPLEFKKGLELIANNDPDTILGIRKGLTLGGRNDFGSDDLVSSMVRGAGLSDRMQQVFDSLGNRKLWDEFLPGIKALAYKTTLVQNTRLYPEMDPERRAELSADQVNARFGIRDVSRLGRSKLLQAMARFVTFAPDWTENQFRSIVGSFGEEGGAQREWWVKNGMLAIGLTELLNLAFTGHTTDKNKGGLMGMLSVELPLTDDKGNPMHINLLGPLAFPINLMMNAPKALGSKGSVLARIAEEQSTGKDWRGRPFATLEDIQSGKFYGTPQHQGFFETLPGRGLALINEVAPIPIEGAIKAATKEGTWPQALGGWAGLPVSRTKPTQRSISEILATGR